MTPRAKLRGFRTSFRFKLFIIFTCLTALITIIFSSLYIVYELRTHRQTDMEKLHMLATHLADNIRLPLYAENREALRQMAEDTARYPDIHGVMISARDGRVLAEYERPDISGAGDTLSETVEVRSSPLGAGPDTAITGTRETSDTLIGRVRLSHVTIETGPMVRRLILTASGIGLVFWLAVSCLSYLALRQVTRSFNALMRGLETMRTGDYALKIDVERDDEPGRAAAAVNELAASLQERDRENQRLQEELLNAMRLEVETEKKLLMAKLIQTNRMTSLGLLASSMAHEINNPNGSIRLAGQFLSRAWRDALPLLQQVSAEEGDFNLGGIQFSAARKNIEECCATIDRNTDRITHVVKDLRSYSLGERNEILPGVDLTQVIAGSLAIIRAHGMHSEATINAECTANVPTITGSYHQLEQVLVNLLLNAVQSLQDGKGNILVSTSFDPGRNEVLIAVSDNGVGIPAEHMRRLRDPFFSTRIHKGGSGLGLFVASFIVSEHSGSLDFSSTPGSGTTVTVRIPVNPPQQA